ncbi:MAG: ABC transporter ATP-binding protein [Saprospiraceae bacterium]|nr:ABC transporter ATP-binding protein [Saprospiraceae bacterium]
MGTVVNVKNLSKSFYINQPRKNLNGLRKFFPPKKQKILALENINFSVEEGQILGIIGKNGSGKSTLLNILIGAMKPDLGSTLEINGKMIKLSLGMGFDLNLSARDNIYINGTILGLSFEEIGRKFKEIVTFAEIGQFIDVPIKRYSKGMRARLGFSIAVHSDSDIYLFDEFFGGIGDELFKHKSNQIFEKTFLNNRTIIMVSHRLGFVNKFCDKALLIMDGKQMDYGDPKEVIRNYKALLETEIK